MSSQKPKISWIEGGIVIGVVAIIDCVMVVIDFVMAFLIITIVAAIAINWMIIFTSVLCLTLWLLIRRSLTWSRAIALWQLVISGLVPFAMTTTVSILVAKVIGGEILDKAAPGASKLAGEISKVV